MKNISLLGATGSIGIQTLDVIEKHSDKFKLVAFSAGRNIDETIKIANKFKPELISVINEEDAKKVENSTGIKCLYGSNGLISVATIENSSILVNAVMGRVGLEPTIEAIKHKKDIALANKETLVTAGHIITKLVKEYNVNLLPIDSEHSAIFQCLNGENPSGINKLIITASGGSFRDKTREELVGVTKEDALNHPNWSMGAKITIDSATMMNKGLEVIEAHWLFDIDYEDIDVVMHYESIIHSMVEMIDGSVLAHLGHPDMRVPILYALTHPNRLDLDSKRLDLAKMKSLNFREMDLNRFPMLRYAYEAGKTGGSMPTVLNAANEAAVGLFLDNRIEFLSIESIVKYAMDNHKVISEPTLAQIQEIDASVREKIYGEVKLWEIS